jgi:hypothetical protein
MDYVGKKAAGRTERRKRPIKEIMRHHITTFSRAVDFIHILRTLFFAYPMPTGVFDADWRIRCRLAYSMPTGVFDASSRFPVNGIA